MKRVVWVIEVDYLDGRGFVVSDFDNTRHKTHFLGQQEIKWQKLYCKHGNNNYRLVKYVPEEKGD